MRMDHPVLKAFVWLVAVAVFGWFTGTLIAAAEVDPSVIAAVLPALVGASLVVVRLSWNDERETSVGLCALIMVFCVASHVSTGWELERRAEEARIAVDEELKLRSEQRERHLERCSATQVRLNAQRETIGLPPLSNEIVCGGFGS